MVDVAARLTDTPKPVFDEPGDLAEMDVISPREGREMLERAAQLNLGMTADEFVKRWESGEFDDEPDRPEVTRVAMLLPIGG